MIRILVEAELDKEIVLGFLRRVVDCQQVEVWACRRSLDPKRTAHEVYELSGGWGGPLIVVYDQESGTIADRPVKLPTQDRVSWCPAIPQIEGWLFADDLALKGFVPDSTLDVVSRLPSPENIPYPKVLKHYMLRDKSMTELIERIDLDRATARSPSLAHFIRSVQVALGVETSYEIENVGSKQLDREIVRSLISEVYPGDSTIFRTTSGAPYTANQMLLEVESGSRIGREYSTAILRVARDLLHRQADRAR
ncbi:MAG: hypothetical protein EON59_01990 [Alphaproteobacteria bacterium]|nr:MAG: hypothetical protein EON59_01990 [Alphaproteobacteria bacterium]